MGKRAVLIISILAVIAMCAFIFAMSAKPADESTELSMGVVRHIIAFIVPGYGQMSPADQLYWQRTLDHPVRKTAHFLEYMALGMLMLNMLWQIAKTNRASGSGEDAKASRSQGGGAGKSLGLRNLAVGAWAVATAYAATDEIHQIFVPGRTGMATDVMLDSTGVLVGVAIAALVLHFARKRKNEQEGLSF